MDDETMELVHEFGTKLEGQDELKQMLDKLIQKFNKWNQINQK